jgi:hypothetical protein
VEIFNGHVRGGTAEARLGTPPSMESGFLYSLYNDTCVNEVNDACVNEVSNACVNEVNSELGPIEIDDYAVMRLSRDGEERLNFLL